jgi:hypothetical protein
MRKPFFTLLAIAAFAVSAFAQSQTKMRPEETEVWKPVPPIVTPGATDSAPPSDAIILFNGKNEDQWVSAQDHTPARWIVRNGILTVNKSDGNIETRRTFRDYQLHIEWKIPTNITGSSQARGNSGVSSPPPAPATTDTSSRSSTPIATQPTSTDRPAASTSKARHW